MTVLLQQRCRNHPDREAVLRCPECRQYYCRECGAEHDGRMLCAACLRKITQTGQKEKRSAFGWPAIVLGAASVISLWLAFYICAKILLAIPSRFHEGTFWK